MTSKKIMYETKVSEWNQEGKLHVLNAADNIQANVFHCGISCVLNLSDSAN